MTINKERIELLCEALESGKYMQGRDALRCDWEDYAEYCCLGVACDISGLAKWRPATDTLSEYLGEQNYLPEHVAEWYGFSRQNPDIELAGQRSSMISANDDAGLSFTDIARALRKTYLGERNAGLS